MTDKTFQLFGQGAIHEGYIAVLQTSVSPLKSGFLEFSESGDDYVLPHQSRIDKFELRQIIAALRPVTMIRKSPYVNPNEVDCILYLRSKEGVFFHIKVSEPQLIIWCGGYVYSGGNSKDFIPLTFENPVQLVWY
jgi:hypothetical protein